MKKYQIITSCIIGILVLALGVFVYINYEDNKTEKLPTSFEFVYSYGVGEKNIVDSQKNSYQKDMVCDPVVTNKLELSIEEKELINIAVYENDFFSIPSDLSQSDNVTCMPESSMTLTVNDQKSGNHTVKWKCGDSEQNPDYKRLMKIINVIDNIISKKDKSLNLPEPSCGYI